MNEVKPIIVESFDKRNGNHHSNNGVNKLSCENGVGNKFAAKPKSKLPTIPYSMHGDKRVDEIILRPLKHLIQIPGKKIRSNLIYGFNFWMKIPNDKLKAINEIIQLIHNVSLLFDDIEDNSTLRRGAPAAHCIYGIATTTLAANYASFIAAEKAYAMDKPEILTLFMEQMLEAHRGQGMDIYWRDNFICPTEEQYKRMVTQKTGSVFNVAVKTMQLFSENKTDFSKLLNILGVYFQIRDDYCNLRSDEYTETKSYCEDLTEGKFSFPIIHAVHSNPDDHEILDILKERTTDFERKKYCVSLLEKYGSFEYTLKALKDLELEYEKEMKCLGENPMLKKTFDDILASKKIHPPKTNAANSNK